MNKKGFTLIEIIAVIIIIGIVTTVGIITISGNLSDSRDSSVADTAIVYADAARKLKATDKLLREPHDGEAVLIPFTELVVDKNDSFATAYGTMVLDSCYIAIVNNKNTFEYYVALLDDTNHNIPLVNINDLNGDSVSVDSSDILKIGDISQMLAVGGNLEIGGKVYKVDKENSDTNKRYILARQ